MSFAKITTFCRGSLRKGSGVHHFTLALLASAIATAGAPQLAMASHGTAAVSDIDGSGPGPHMGSYAHSGADHPWYTFDATAGETVTVSLTTSFPSGSFLWIYEVLDGSAMVGDSTGGGELTLVATSFNTDFLPGPYPSQVASFVAPNTNQYIVQVDAWLSFTGDQSFSLVISPCPCFDLGELLPLTPTWCYDRHAPSLNSFGYSFPGAFAQVTTFWCRKNGTFSWVAAKEREACHNLLHYWKDQAGLTCF